MFKKLLQVPLKLQSQSKSSRLLKPTASSLKDIFSHEASQNCLLQNIFQLKESRKVSMKVWKYDGKIIRDVYFCTLSFSLQLAATSIGVICAMSSKCKTRHVSPSSNILIIMSSYITQQSLSTLYISITTRYIIISVFSIFSSHIFCVIFFIGMK